MIFDIVLVSDEETKKILKAHPDFSDMHFHLVSDGAAPIEGLRIRNAYVDRYCYEDSHYLQCLERIQSSMELTTRIGRMYLL